MEVKKEKEPQNLEVRVYIPEESHELIIIKTYTLVVNGTEVDIEGYIKYTLHGRTAKDFKNSDDYQTVLTTLQQLIKKHNRLDTKFINDFFRLDYKQKPNWNKIMSRIDQDKQDIYLDFIDRINPGNINKFGRLFEHDIPKLTGHKSYNTIQRIITLLKPFCPKITSHSLDIILQGEKPRDQVLWNGSKRELSCFLGLLKKEQRLNRKLVPVYFVFINGPASVDDGGVDYETKLDSYSQIKSVSDLILSLNK